MNVVMIGKKVDAVTSLDRIAGLREECAAKGGLTRLAASGGSGETHMIIWDPVKGSFVMLFTSPESALIATA